MENKIFSLIIGRKGSKGFPGKNYFEINGNPLCYYPMRASQQSEYVAETYLSTDDEKLAAIAKENKVEIIERPEELCTSEALGEDVFVHGYREIIKRNPDKKIKYMVLLFCNSPTVTCGMIDEAIEILNHNPDYDSVISVSKYNMWSPIRARKIGADGLLHPFVPLEIFGDVNSINCDRDSQGDVWFADMGLSVVRPRCLENLKDGLLPQKWMGQKIYPLKQSCGLDVDYEWQIGQVTFWLKENEIV